MTFRLTRRAALAALALPAIARAQAPTTITMWTFVDPTRPGGRETALKQMIESFERANPTLKVRVEPQVWTTLAEKFVLGHNAGNAPDICWVNGENMGLILGSDAAADLKPLVDAWSPAMRADYLLPSALTAVTVKNQLLAMPLMASTWVLMYRRDLLAKAGLGPEVLKTWDGVVQAATAMTRRATPDAQPDIWGIGLGLATERYSVTPAVLAAIGGQNGLFGDGCAPRIATPAVGRAVSWQAELITRHRVTPREALAMTSDDAIDQFAAGRYAMELISNARFEQIQRNAAGWNRDDLAMAPTPGWTADKPGPTLITGWNAVAWRKSPRLAHARAFIAHMTSPEALALWNLPGGQVPMLRSLTERPEMALPANLPLRQVAGYFGTAGFTMPSQCAWARTLADLNLATQQVVLGQRSLADALKQAELATKDRQ